MSEITIYGCSDDLVEIEGSIDAEFTAFEGLNLLAFSDGTLVEVTYTNSGIWRVNTIHKSPTVGVVKVEAAADAYESDNYSDRMTLTGEISWVVHATTIARCK